MSSRRKYLVLALCCSSLFLVSLDTTIVNVALPSIARELGSSVSKLQWTVDAYLLVLSALLLLSGSLADRVGRKRVFIVGIGIFASGSLLCSLAPTDGWLIAFRMYQAVGGSAMTPVALAIVTNMFVAPDERAKAIGWWAAVSGIGIAAGPLTGGLLIDSIGWRSIFLINVPIAAAVLVLTLLFAPESRAARPRAFDPVGQVTVVAFLGSLIFAIIEAPRFGLGSSVILGAAVVAAAALGVLLWYERRRTDALVPLTLFKVRSFSTSFAIAVLGFLAFAGLLFTNTLYLQEDRGLSASLAGVLTLPLAAATIVAAPLSGRMMARAGARLPLLIAGGLMGAGGLLLVVLTPAAALAWLVLPYALFGGGYGMLNAPVNDTAISELPDDRAGVAASLISTSKQVGAALGVAISGALIASFQGGFTEVFAARGWLLWVVIAGCGFAIFGIALPRRAIVSPQSAGAAARTT